MRRVKVLVGNCLVCCCRCCSCFWMICNWLLCWLFIIMVTRHGLKSFVVNSCIDKRVPTNSGTSLSFQSEPTSSQKVHLDHLVLHGTSTPTRLWLGPPGTASPKSPSPIEPTPAKSDHLMGPGSKIHQRLVSFKWEAASQGWFLH